MIVSYGVDKLEDGTMVARPVVGNWWPNQDDFWMWTRPKINIYVKG